MRPVRLRIEGFTCYREKQEIDFSRLTLFAIAGPTGAGKSSILDSIAFALYGRIPRMGAQNLDEFISLGASRASVLFEFSVQNQNYRVVRSMPRSGQRKVQLEAISEGRSRSLADSVNEVNAQLQRILGLDYEAFIQSVLLPQGDFSKFLKSKPGDQREILRDLLRMGVYEKMRERANSQAKELAQAIDADGRLLEDHYAGATPQNVAASQEFLQDLRRRLSAASGELVGARQLLSDARERWRLVQERSACQEKLVALDQQQSKMDALRAAVQAAGKAAQALPIVDHAATRLSAWRAAEEEAERLTTAANTAEMVAKSLGVERAEAQTSYDSLPGKRTRLLVLSGIEPVVRERDAVAVKCAGLRGQLTKAEADLARSDRAVASAEGDTTTQRAKLASLTKLREELGHDATLFEVFRKAERLAYELDVAQQQLAASDSVPLTESLHVAETGLEEGERGLAVSEGAHRIAADAARLAQEHWEAVQDQHRAASLRLGLKPGCACPVCEQTVSTVSTGRPPDDLEEARGRYSQTRSASAAAEEDLGKARIVAARRRAEAASARKALADWEADAAQRVQKVDALASDLRKAIHPFGSAVDQRIDLFVLEELRGRQQVRDRWDAITSQSQKVELEVQRAEAKRDSAQATRDTNQREINRLLIAVEEAEAKLAEHEAQITSVGSADPLAELESLKKAIENIETRHQGAVAKHTSAQQAAHDAALAANSAQSQRLAAVTERDASAFAAEKAISDAGFTSVADLRSAMMDPVQVVTAEQTLRSFDTTREIAQVRMRELDAQLQGKTISEADLQHAEDQTAHAESEVSELGTEIGRRSADLETLDQLTQKAELLREEHQKRRLRHGLMHRLAQDLRGDAFQQYLLEGSFARLVQGASGRLRELNERFELTFGDGKFAVIDHDHGSLSRLADTLSGGETFLVSLALALELSEQVQRAAGAVRLDSLFIDEGFGTLDPETLETVADAIESLSKTNRMIGVISHVPELHRRLPRLEVRPTPTGSIVQYVEE